MKESILKTGHSMESVQTFVAGQLDTDPESLQQLAEGHVSQAFRFMDNCGEMRVLRLAPQEDDFLKDQYAANHFKGIPIPRVISIGEYDPETKYCVTNYVEGVTSDDMTQTQIDNALPNIHKAFADIFHIDIRESSGYGVVSPIDGNGQFESYEESLIDRINEFSIEERRAGAIRMEVDPSLVDRFYQQAINNLTYASGTRRVVHGDLGFDNLLMNNSNVAAVIDWAHLQYGDWMDDFSKFDFWWPGRFGDAHQFAVSHGLEAEHLNERRAFFWAITGLSTINFADKAKNYHIVEWLNENAANKIV